MWPSVGDLPGRRDLGETTLLKRAVERRASARSRKTHRER
jgi:hypothetical protein